MRTRGIRRAIEAAKHADYKREQVMTQPTDKTTARPWRVESKSTGYAWADLETSFQSYNLRRHGRANVCTCGHSDTRHMRPRGNSLFRTYCFGGRYPGDLRYCYCNQYKEESCQPTSLKSNVLSAVSGLLARRYTMKVSARIVRTR